MGAFKSKGTQAAGVIAIQSESVNLKPIATAIKPAPYRVGEWLPSDQAVLDSWLSALIEEVDGPPAAGDQVEEVDADDEAMDEKLHPVIREFKHLIKNDAVINMFFHQMFSEVPKKFQKDPTGQPQVRSYHQALRLINRIMTKAPELNESGLVGFPINAILDWPMGTTGGYAAFLNDSVNQQLKKFLIEWGTFLKSEDSRYVLSDNPQKGWFGENARKAMPCFAVEFECDPSKPHYGFKSWDDFFTRKFRDGIHPIAAPNDDRVIVNACESSNGMSTHTNDFIILLRMRKLTH